MIPITQRKKFGIGLFALGFVVSLVSQSKFSVGDTPIRIWPNKYGANVGLVIAIVGLILIFAREFKGIPRIPFNRRGYLLSIPTVLVCLPPLLGVDPGPSFPYLFLAMCALTLPWSIAAGLAFLALSQCCAGGGPGNWWDIWGIFGCCAFAAVGAHINGSFIFRSFNRPPDDISDH